MAAKKRTLTGPEISRNIPSKVELEPVGSPYIKPPRLVHLVIVMVLAAITWFIFSVCLSNQFTDWDDAGYIVNNSIVRDLSSSGLTRIFSESVMGNYHPLTVLSYALEYNSVELDPWLYHLDSLLAHILSALLVYVFVNLLTGRYIAAIVASLLFALHPMHVESAAWVAGRKDLLYCIFFVSACITYIYQNKPGRNKPIWYILTLLLFLFAVLSKPVAVMLPLILILIDLYQGRPWHIKLLIEKIPHFLIALTFGIISFTIQHGGGAMDAQKIHFNLIERIALGCYALCTYIWKAVVPAHLCAFYPYPAKVNDSLPFIYYIYPLLVITALVVVWKYLRKNKPVMFGLGFFITTIFLLLQFIPVGQAILADRYSYVPYLGIFIIAGYYIAVSFEKNIAPAVKYVLLSGSALYVSICAYACHERCKVWYDANTLWADEVNKEPDRAALAYNNLGFIYFNKKSATTDQDERRIFGDSAIYLMNKAIEIDPTIYNSVQGLGMLYYMKGDFETSASYFRRLIAMRPVAESYSDYANVQIQMGRRDSALILYTKALELNPTLPLVLLNRGRLLRDMNRFDECRQDMDKVISVDPNIGEAYYIRSFYFADKGNKAAALQDIDKAAALGYKQINSDYYQRLKN